MIEKNKEKGGQYKEQKKLYVKNKNSSNEDDSDSKEALFLVVSSQYEQLDHEDKYIEDLDNEVVIDIEGEFICARGELKKLKNKCSLVKEQLA